MSTPVPRLSVVIPVRDEADNLAALAHEVHAALTGRFDYELLIVDDGSTDDSPTVLRALIREPGLGPRLRVLRHAQSCGQSAALWTGVQAARAPLIATLDGDGQNDPADIPRLLAALEAADRATALGLVIGHRRQRHDAFTRRVASRVANGLRRRLLADDTPDTGCGIKVFPRDLYLRLPYFDHMHRFLPALVHREGAGVLSVPVAHRRRQGGRSKYGIWDRLWVGIIDLFGVAWLKARDRRPVRVEELDRDA